VRSENRQHIHGSLNLQRAEPQSARAVHQIETFYVTGRRPKG